MMRKITADYRNWLLQAADQEETEKRSRLETEYVEHALVVRGDGKQLRDRDRLIVLNIRKADILRKIDDFGEFVETQARDLTAKLKDANQSQG